LTHSFQGPARVDNTHGLSLTYNLRGQHDPREQPRRELRHAVYCRDQRTQLGVFEFGERGDDWL
jgi:hypothetical protein